MTHQNNEELREKIADFLEYHVDSSAMDGLMSIIESSQTEPLVTGKFEESCPHCKKAIYILPRRMEQIEVEIVKHPIVGARTILYKIVCVGNFNIDFLDKFYSKQEALDFCKRYNLKIVNEEVLNG